jgi:serine/threonine-protein kinase RsbW
MRMDVSLTLPRKPVSVPLARGLVSSTLARAGVMPEIVTDIEVALTEACTNAYKHAEAGETYELRICLDDEFFAMEVVDRGPRFGSRTVQAASVEEPDAGHHDEGGRGLGVIRALTDSVAFLDVSDDGSGRVQMQKRVTWRDQSPWLVSRLPLPGEDGEDVEDRTD